MRFRTLTAALLSLVAAHAFAFDANFARRSRMPGLPQPNVDAMIVHSRGPGNAVDGVDVASPDPGSIPLALATRVQHLPLTAADFGMKCDGITDDAQNFRRALAVLRGRPNPTLELPNATCAIGTTIETPDWSNVNLVGWGGGTGAGTNTNFQDGTVLKWIGPPGGVMLDWRSPLASRPFLTASSSIVGLTLDGNGLAGTGLYVRGLYNSRVGIKVRHVIHAGVDIDIYSGGGADVQLNRSDYINIDLNYPESKNADGLVFGPGNSYNDSHHNVWSNISIVHQAGTGIKLGNIDTDTFINIQAQWPVDGSGVRTGPGLVFTASPNPIGPGGVTQAARDLKILGASIASGTFARAGIHGLPSNNNVIFGFTQGSNEPSPVIERGASLDWVSTTGEWHIRKIYPYQQIWKSPGDFDVIFLNPAGATVGYFGTDGILTGVPSDALRIRGVRGVAIGAHNNASIVISPDGFVSFPQIIAANGNADAAKKGVPSGGLFYNMRSGALSLRQ